MADSVTFGIDSYSVMHVNKKDVRMKPWQSIEPKGPLLRPKHAAEYLGISSRGAYYILAKKGVVPPTIHIGQGPTGFAGVPLSWLEATVRARAAGVLA